MHLQKRCVAIFERASRQVEHLKSSVRDVSSLSMCHNNMQYSYPELFVPKFASPSGSVIILLSSCHQIWESSEATIAI